MVLEHHLHAFEDRGGAGLKSPEAIGDLPKRHDARAAKANKGNNGSWVHAGKRTAPMQGSSWGKAGKAAATAWLSHEHPVDTNSV